MIILGLNAYQADSAACILRDGKLIAAAEEERFRRVRHWSGFPVNAIQYCLEAAGAKISDIDHIALNRDPKANVGQKAISALSKKLSLEKAWERLKNAQPDKDIKLEMMMTYRVRHTAIRAKVHNVEHHLAHLASAYLVSPCDKAAVVSIDDYGDFVSAMWGIGEGGKITVMNRVFFPHSLGLFYLAFTQFLGFTKYGDESKAMHLAANGKPTELSKMENILELCDRGHFKLNLDYFTHHIHGTPMAWDSGEPDIGPVYSELMEKDFGAHRKPGEPVTGHHKNIAASMQAQYEEAFINLLNSARIEAKSHALCLAGGCAMNSMANSLILDRTSFREIYIPPAVSDAGGAIGAAFYVHGQLSKGKREFIMDNACWGPSFNNDEIEALLQSQAENLQKHTCFITMIDDDNKLCKTVAKYVADGCVVGWFQGRMEWGPRALGSRGIIADPRKQEMKLILTSRTGAQGLYQPFTASILLEDASDYFETAYHPDPFMFRICSIKRDMRQQIPAVVHAGGTGRFQTVSASQNQLFSKLIKEFKKITGVPVLINMPFDDDEPTVCKPEEALDRFLRTKMDVLVLGSYIIKR